MIIVYGTRVYGTVDAEDGTQHATRFAHVYYLPKFPVEGLQLFWVGLRGFARGPVA